MMDYGKTLGKSYSVVGRYMTGSEVTAYHLRAGDGEQLYVTKERAVHMIGRGLIENLRVQYSGSSVIIRGKGVNLMKLPVFDEKTQRIRGEAGEIKVKKLGTMVITKAIQDRGKTIGYELKDASGKNLRVQISKVRELAKEGLIYNAKVQDYEKDGKRRVILRGHNGTQLNELPKLWVNGNGVIVDPERDINEISYRAVKMRKGGTLYNLEKGTKEIFGVGDYIVCGLFGELRSVKERDILKLFEVDREVKMATCDNDLTKLEKYPIELFGKEKMYMKEDIVKSWGILKARKQ